MAYHPKYYAVILFDPLELHFFRYILPIHSSRVFIYALSWWSFIFTVGGA